MITFTLEAGFGSTMLTASPTWTTLAKMRSWSMDRGRPSVDQRFETGTGRVVVDNRDGNFDPFNTAGAHYPDVKIGVPIRLTAEIDGVSGSFPIFYMQARSWKPSYPTGNIDATVSITLADGFYTLANEDLGGNTYPAQRTDERITAVLDDVGWPAALRDLDTGVATVQAVEFAQPEDGGENTALAHLLDVAESEAGALFMSPDGKVVFQNRVAQSGASSAATYDGEDDYSEIDPKPDDTVLYNVIRIAREDGAQIEYVNSTSVAAHDRRVLTRDVMPMGNDAEALNVAEWLSAIFGEQRQRIDGLKFKPLKDAALLEELLGFDLREVVTVQQTRPGDDLNELCAIEHIHMDWVPDDLNIAWSVAPLTTTETQDYWILGTSQLGTDTRLA